MANLPILFRIQEIHNRQRALKKLIAETGENSVLIQLRAGKTDCGKKLASIVKKQESSRKRQQQLDLELKSCLEKMQQEETKLYGGSVVNSRELEQIQQKVTEYVNSKTQIEEAIFQLMEEEEKLTKLRNQVSKADHLFDQKLVILETEIKQKNLEYNLELAQLDNELNDLLPLVPEEWLNRLDKIADSHNGIGIAQIKSGCCGACHVSLSESLLQKAKRGEDQILLCENCGRIIFY